MTQGGVAIVIVTFNSQPEISACLEAARRAGDEIVVVDNASTDGTQAAVNELRVRMICNSSNLGFAAAVNQGVKATRAPFVLLLNPDAILETGIGSLVEACALPRAAAAGGKLVGLNGHPQRGFMVRNLPTPAALCFELIGINKLVPANPINWNYRCLGLDLDRPAEVEQPAGAFLLFRRDAWERMSGFDEGFFPIWFEDVDFCKRLRDADYQVFYRPDCRARHAGGHSICRISLGMRTEYWYRSLLRYSDRHFHGTARVLTCLSVVIGSILRAVFGGKSQRSREMIQIYRRIVRLAFRSLRGRGTQFGEILQ